MAPIGPPPPLPKSESQIIADAFVQKAQIDQSTALQVARLELEIAKEKNKGRKRSSRSPSESSDD